MELHILVEKDSSKDGLTERAINDKSGIFEAVPRNQRCCGDY